jgi:hypothetical protein
MFLKSLLFRVMVLAACLSWGLLEFFALQRVRLSGRRMGH